MADSGWQQQLPDSTGSSHIIELIGVNKYFGEAHVLRDISFYIRQNEFITLLGPSGCGKSTTLRILAGFEQANSGQVLFEGRDLLAIPPYERHLNTVFQRYALFPISMSLIISPSVCASRNSPARKSGPGWNRP